MNIPFAASKQVKKTIWSALTNIVMVSLLMSMAGFTQTALESVTDALEPIKTAEAQAYPHTFLFSLHAKDGNCSGAALAKSAVPGTGVNGGSVVSQSPYYSDSNTEDPDCLSIGLYATNANNGDMHFGALPQQDSIVQKDFRIGIRLSEKGSGNCLGDSGTLRWTPWASEGGGTSSAATTHYSDERADCAWLSYEQRDMPAGIEIKNIRAGISAGNGGVAYTDWIRNSTSQTDSFGRQSRWSAYSAGSDRLDPVRLTLDVQFVDNYDAEYVSDSIPDTMDPNQSGTYNIVMRNKASVWTTDEPSINACPPPAPAYEGQTCSWSGQATSSQFKLERYDSDGQITLIGPVGASPLAYQRDVTRNYEVSSYCTEWYNPPDDPPDDPPVDIEPPAQAFLDNLGGIKTAQADVGEYCIAWDMGFFMSSQAPTNWNVANTNTATFPISLKIEPGASNGVHNLQFRMVNLATGERFGTATIPVTVGGPGYAVTCTPPATTVAIGDTTAFNLSTTASGGFNSPVTWTHSISPSSSNPPTISYTNNGQTPPATTTAVVTTTGTTTPAAYTIVFTASGGAVPSQQCSVSLTVQYVPSSPTDYSFGISPASTDVFVGTTVPYDVTLVCMNGAPGPATNLTASSALSGATYTFTSSQVNCGQTIQLLVDTTNVNPTQLSKPALPRNGFNIMVGSVAP